MFEGQRRIIMLGAIAVVLAVLLLGSPPPAQTSNNSARFVGMLQDLDWAAVLSAPDTGISEEFIDPDVYEPIAEQPLFVADRRHAPPPATVAEPVEAMPAPEPVAPPSVSTRFSVAAILIQNGEPLAMIRGPRGKLHRVVREDRVEGWMVAAIEPRRIILRYEDQTDELVLGAKADRSGEDNR